MDDFRNQGGSGGYNSGSNGQGEPVNPCKLYVGNLDYTVRGHDLSELFSQFGQVVDAVVIMDKTKRDWSKGFGFVEFANPEEAEKAVESLHDQEFRGRKMIVNVAQPKPTKKSGNALDDFVYY